MDLKVEEINNFTPEQKAKFYSQPDFKKSSVTGKKIVFKNAFLGVFIALIIAGGFWYVVSKQFDGDVVMPFSEGSKGTGNNVNKIQNPLTGILYTEEQAVSWKDTRPLAVMINNYFDARPQSGLNDADLVYEIVAEGGITRFLAFFLTNTPDKIGPVRSTREYYLVLVKELGDAMLMHIGWSPQALVAIESWPVRSLGRGGASFWRDEARLNAGVAVEHTAYVKGSDLRTLGEELGWTGNRPIQTWQFKDDFSYWGKGTKPELKDSSQVSIDFWYKGDYSGVFKYDSVSNSYLRYTGYDESNNPIPQIDQETKEHLKVKNVIVQFAIEDTISGDEKNRLDYQLIGSGKGLVFMDGKVVDVTWSKAGRDDRTMFYDLNGNEIAFNRGKFWISIVPDRNVDQVIY